MSEWKSIDKKPPNFSKIWVKVKNGTIKKCYHHGDGLGRLAFYFKKEIISDFVCAETKCFLYDVTHWRDL